jgi:hypothetical protein
MPCSLRSPPWRCQCTHTIEICQHGWSAWDRSLYVIVGVCTRYVTSGGRIGPALQQSRCRLTPVAILLSTRTLPHDLAGGCIPELPPRGQHRPRHPNTIRLLCVGAYNTNNDGIDQMETPQLPLVCQQRRKLIDDTMTFDGIHDVLYNVFRSMSVCYSVHPCWCVATRCRTRSLGQGSSTSRLFLLKGLLSYLHSGERVQAVGHLAGSRP